MTADSGFLQAMLEEPGDLDLRLIFADWLDEQDDAESAARGELLRLTHRLIQQIDIPYRQRLEERMYSLLARGVRPVGPVYENSIGLRLAWIPPGTFVMGSPETEEGRDGDENPHRVTLENGFFLGVYPVTQAEWAAVMGNAPSHFQGAELPAEQVNWFDCQQFCQRLSEREGRLYRLPTEEEWEYACRAGTTTPFHFGPTLSTAEANFDGTHGYGTAQRGEYRRRTTPVGIFPPNAFGLYDMHGNVWEWCEDWYGSYWRDQRSDFEEEDHSSRVVRGGCWSNRPRGCRAAFRGLSRPSACTDLVGCRVCMPLEGEP
jgi:uncharacterized protein (TIGR02996 family)